MIVVGEHFRDVLVVCQIVSRAFGEDDHGRALFRNFCGGIDENFRFEHMLLLLLLLLLMLTRLS